MENNDYRSIGVLDSGIGGLSVLKELQKKLPFENTIYVADLKRFPYGNKSKEEIIKYSKEICNFLLKNNVKAIVIACHTISSIALNELKKNIDIPIFSMLNPSIEKLKRYPNKKFLMIGTENTINNSSYISDIKKEIENLKIIPLAMQKLVGYIENREKKEIISDYLNKTFESYSDIDGVFLACTHFPLIKNLIKKAFIKKIAILDPSFILSKDLKRYLKKNNLLNLKNKTPNHLFYITQKNNNFIRIAQNYLNPMRKPLEDNYDISKKLKVFYI